MEKVAFQQLSWSFYAELPKNSYAAQKLQKCNFSAGANTAGFYEAYD